MEEEVCNEYCSNDAGKVGQQAAGHSMACVANAH